MALDDDPEVDLSTLPANRALLNEVDAQIAAAQQRRHHQQALAGRIGHLVPEAAMDIEARVQARGAQHATEEDLRGGVADALRAQEELVVTEARLAVPTWTRNLDGFDIAIVADDSLVAAQTKWADGNLAECLWDLFKLGCALEINRVDAAVAICGAPVKHWQRPTGPGRLFEDQDVVGRELVEGHPREWAWNLAGSTARPGAVPMLMKLRVLNTTQIHRR